MAEKKKKIFKKKPLRFGNTLKSYKNICFYCGTKLDDYSRTVDHLIPECDGGIRSNDNKVYACRDCNQLKGNMHPDEFYKFLSTLLEYEAANHRKKTGYIKKVRLRVGAMIKAKKK